MSRWVRVTAWSSGVVVVIVVALLVTTVWTVHRSFPDTSGTVHVEGLDGRVEVIRDSAGIPQVYADTPHDLFYGQGYVQAQDRFFEMDFRRHLTAGRLTELFGRDALETDMFVRTLGWRRVAEEELPLLSPVTRTYLDAYAEGVNAYLADHSGATLSLEYAVLGLGGLDYTPEEWTPADSLAWLKAMAWNLGTNMTDEIERSLDAVHLTRPQIAELFPPYPAKLNQPIVNQGAVVDGVFEQDATKGGTRLPSRPPFLLKAAPALRQARDAAAVLDDQLGTGAGAGSDIGLGSNAWAVSGAHTASGSPILANDPHLGPSLPSVWYQMGLHCTTVDKDCPFDVAGFTFAGTPGVIIGHNADIAWGFTNLYPDTQDLYLEKVDDNQYLYQGRERPLTMRQESFSIEGEDDPVEITVRASRHGPLISDVSDDIEPVGSDAPVPGSAPDRGAGYAVALRWSALQPSRTADALFGFDTAKNWNTFRSAASLFAAPSQNLVYADAAGHIGYQAPGNIPIRRTGHGDWPVPGWDPAYEWDDEPIPFDALPHVLDPPDGYVVTANQAITHANYPYYIGDSFDYGYRAQRIRDLLEDRDNITVDDMAQIQLDDDDALARAIVPRLLKVKLSSDYYRQGQRVLKGWDFRDDADSSGAAYFNVFWRQLLANTFHDQLPKDTWPVGGSRWWQVMLQLLRDPHNTFWDDVDTPDVTETRDDILSASLEGARDELTRLRSRDPHDWAWGDLHTLTLRNETLGKKGSPVGFIFNSGPYRLSGSSSVVDATAWDASKGYEVTAAPSMRMVVPLDDLDGSRWINLSGASGHAHNDHYTDQTDLWVQGKTLPWYFSRDRIESEADQTLVLAPSAG